LKKAPAPRRNSGHKVRTYFLRRASHAESIEQRPIDLLSGATLLPRRSRPRIAPLHKMKIARPP
jgi:hypothetical protein